MNKQSSAMLLTKDRTALRGRIRRFYEHFNRMDWQYCFECLDPRLREAGKVDFSSYSECLADFHRTYGEVKEWHINISLHRGAKTNKRDDRDFAYVYLFWQDKHHAFHVFRERWVKQEGKWYTRVVGLVAHDQKPDKTV